MSRGQTQRATDMPLGVNDRFVTGVLRADGVGRERRGTIQEGEEGKSRHGRKGQFKEFQNLKRV